MLQTELYSSLISNSLFRVRDIKILNKSMHLSIKTSKEMIKKSKGQTAKTLQEWLGESDMHMKFQNLSKAPTAQYVMV